MKLANEPPTGRLSGAVALSLIGVWGEVPTKRTTITNYQAELTTFNSHRE